jgi:hypothetical protein
MVFRLHNLQQKKDLYTLESIMERNALIFIALIIEIIMEDINQRNPITEEI